MNRSSTSNLRWPSPLAFVALFLGTSFPLASADSVPSLARWPSGEPVSWESFRGGVVVLDFFAPWCLPCREVSRETQEGIARYYREKGGNPHGVPIHVLAVNIDTSSPENTCRFLQAAALDETWLDTDGRLFESFGGRSVPLTIVLDVTSPRIELPGRVTARFEGNPGLKRLRGVIDRIASSAGAVQTGAEPRSRWESLRGRHASGLAELTGEGLLASDCQIAQSSLVWTENRDSWDVRVQLGGTLYDLDYMPAPSDFISSPARLCEDQYSVQGRLRVRYAPRWQAELGGGGYDGFADYRSVWLDHYYREYFAGQKGYREVQPAGYNIGPALRWECLSSTAWLQAGLVYQHDTVSPGYEKRPFRPLIRGTDELETVAGSLSLENVWSRQVRSLQNLRVTDTTERDPRYEYTLSVNWAPAERWVVHSGFGFTLEPPDFHAYRGELGVDRDWANRWFVGLFARYYTDDGLVRDPRIASTASPPLETWQVGLSLRYQSERWSAKLSAGPYFTRYAPVPAISRDFSTLYADRDWLLIQAAVGLRY